MDIFGQVRKDEYEYQLRVYEQPDSVGALLPFWTWRANNPELAGLNKGGTIWAVTVRPGGRVWLVARYENAKLQVRKAKPYFRVTSNENLLPIVDITRIAGALKFTNRKPLDMRPSVLPHSAQTMGLLTKASVKLLRGVVSASPSPSDETTTSDEGHGARAQEGFLIEELTRRRTRDAFLREERLRIDKFLCQSCGFTALKAGLPETVVLEVHHIDPLRDTGEVVSEIEDLLTLCPTCHRVIHAAAAASGQQRGLSLKFLKRTWRSL